MDDLALRSAVAQLAEHVEEHYRDAEPELGVVLVAAELEFTDEDGDRSNTITFWCSDARRFVQVGFLDLAQAQVRAGP